MVRVSKPRVVLCDVEGTTSSISFVQCLFTYARDHLKQYLTKNICSEHTLSSIKLLWEQYQEDRKQFADLPQVVAFGEIDLDREDKKNGQIGGIVDYVLWLMDSDRKVTALKVLQGNIWKDGYEDGSIKGDLYEEVASKLKQWVEQHSIVLGIYSSGSVLAQKLLFANTIHGDLSKYIQYYFDTNVGAKQDSQSYKNIIAQVGVQPREIVFLTDISKEAKAASQAGMVTILLDREGKLTDEEKELYDHVTDFNEICFE